MQRQDPGGDKTGRDDDHRGRGLNERCDKHTEEKRLHRVVRHLFHGKTQRAGGVFLQ